MTTDLVRCQKCHGTKLFRIHGSAKWTCCACDMKVNEKPMRSFATVALDELSKEYDKCRAERAHVVDVLTRFKAEELSLSSVQPLFTLLDYLLEGPKETPCPPA